MAFTIDKAQIVGLFVQSVFYGIYLISFVYCLRCLLWGDEGNLKSRGSIHWPMVAATVLFMMFLSFDLSLLLLHNIEAFVLYTGPGGALAEFYDISNWMNVLKSVCIFVCVVMGDAMLIYRCWIVHSRSFTVIVIPSLLWLADTACACVLTWIEATLHSLSLLNAQKLKPFLTSFTAITIVQNIITTSLIVYRIYLVDHENALLRPQTQLGISSTTNRRRSRLQQVMRIVIESGLLYTTFAFASFVCYMTNSSAFYVATDMEVNVIGIAFNLIIIRANKQSADEYTFPSKGMLTNTFLPFRTFKSETGTEWDTRVEFETRTDTRIRNETGTVATETDGRRSRDEKSGQLDPDVEQDGRSESAINMRGGGDSKASIPQGHGYCSTH